jgi:hypothetical protein
VTERRRQPWCKHARAQRKYSSESSFAFSSSSVLCHVTGRLTVDVIGEGRIGVVANEMPINSDTYSHRRLSLPSVLTPLIKDDLHTFVNFDAFISFGENL